MEDDARRIVEGYEQEWDVKLIPKATPCTNNLYEEAGIIRSQEKDFKKLKPKQIKKLQEKLEKQKALKQSLELLLKIF